MRLWKKTSMVAEVFYMIKTTEFQLPELFIELVHDALKAVSNDERWKITEIALIPYNAGHLWQRNIPMPHLYSFETEGIELTVLPNHTLRVRGKHVDDSADLVTNIEALLNWIYEGGQFPLMKEEERWNPDT